MSSFPVGDGDQLGNLRSWVARLVGQECWDAYLPDGQELQLEIGERRVVEGQRRDLELGAWGLIIGASTWEVTGTQADEADKTADSSGLHAVRGVITNASVGPDLTLRLELDGERTLELTPRGGQRDDVPYWELFVPDGMYFSVGPDEMVTYKRADARA
jgi:hypothetical protein